MFLYYSIKFSKNLYVKKIISTSTGCPGVHMIFCFVKNHPWRRGSSTWQIIFSASYFLWSWPVSNRWPPACKAGVLPAELQPQKIKEQKKSCHVGTNQAFSQLPATYLSYYVGGSASGGNYNPNSLFVVRFSYFVIPEWRTTNDERRLVGPGRVELPTSRLSGVRSNQLSYEPWSVLAHKSGVRSNQSRHPHNFFKEKIICGAEDPRFDPQLFY